MMDGSCLARIFPSKKKKKKNLNALAHTIHANMHTDINIIYPPPLIHTHTHTHHGPPRFVEMPVEKEKCWAGLWSQRGWGNSAGWQATNSRQLGQSNWKSGRRQIWDCVPNKNRTHPQRNYVIPSLLSSPGRIVWRKELWTAADQSQPDVTAGPFSFVLFFVFVLFLAHHI